jgi:hypothetical protein
MDATIPTQLKTRARASWSATKMASRKNPEVTEDQLILKARRSSPEILDRLLSIAQADPPTHASIAAAKLVLDIANKETKQERNPMGMLTAFDREY